MSDEYPLLSAMMLAGRVNIEDVMACIECFKNQTYPNKELVVINNAPDQFSASELNILAEPTIHLVDTPVEFSAGMARNYGISATNGQILAQFDPDFWHAPERLESQVGAMARGGAHVCALASVLSYSFVSGRARLFTNSAGAILATMVYTRPVQIDYPDIDKCEEREIFQRMTNAGMNSVSIDKPELCCKLHLSDNGKAEKPVNCGLSKARIALIRKIVKTLV